MKAVSSYNCLALPLKPLTTIFKSNAISFLRIFLKSS